MGFIAHPDHTRNRIVSRETLPLDRLVRHRLHGPGNLGFHDGLAEQPFRPSSGHPELRLSRPFSPRSCSGYPRTLGPSDTSAPHRRNRRTGQPQQPETYLGNSYFRISLLQGFRLIRTHILLDKPFSGDSRSDIPTLLDALKRGRAYISLDHFRPANGFSLILTEEGRKATMGDEFILHHSAELRASVSPPGTDSPDQKRKTFPSATGKELSVTLREPGVYRIEADLKAFGRYRPWIFSNPIYVTHP